MSSLRFVVSSLLLCLCFQVGLSVCSVQAASDGAKGQHFAGWHKERVGVPMRKPRVGVLPAEEDEIRDQKHHLKLYGALVSGTEHYDYLPVFSEENLHFLLHYAAAHKGKLGRLYVWHRTFII